MLIRAQHFLPAKWLFDRYLWFSLRMNFFHFYVVNLPPTLPPHQSLLVTPNHMSWWDGFLMYQVNKIFFKRNFHIMMLHRQLSRFWFFRFLGSYSLDPEQLSSIKETFAYTGRLLTNPHNLVVMYPQGVIQPFDQRPCHLKRGLQLLLKQHQPPCLVLPVAFKIQFGEEKKPDVFFRCGNPIEPKTIQEDFRYFSGEFEANLEALNQAALSNHFQFELLRGRWRRC